jgi:hypothetical protein
MHHAPFQAKLTVGQTGDMYEREADDIAKRDANGSAVLNQP